MAKKKIDPDDLTGNMFKQAFSAALESCGGKVHKLSAKLGLKSRCYYWETHLPPYEKMKEYYPKLLAISQEKEANLGA